MEKFLTYAIKDGILVNVKSVPNGIACGCICPNCKERLVAVSNLESKTYMNSAHFRHESGVDCVGAYESALHLLAKEVLSKFKKLQIPDYHFDYDSKNQFSFQKSFEVHEFQECVLEQRLEFDDFYFVPDLIGYSQRRKVLIEFAYTHFIDLEKRDKIRKSKIPCIEIDIRGMELDKEELEKLFISKTQNIYWISNPIQDKVYWKKEYDRKKNLEIELQLKLEALKMGKVNTIKIVNQKLWICPKKVDFFRWFKTTKYYQHPILKEIADGKYWNERFYGRYSTEEYIFFNEEKVYTSVFPYSGVENDPEMAILRRGLKTIVERKNLNADLCGFCAFEKGVFKFEDEAFQICSFKGDREFIKDVAHLNSSK